MLSIHPKTSTLKHSQAHTEVNLCVFVVVDDDAHAKSSKRVFITSNTSIDVHVCVCVCVPVVDSIARNLGHQPILTAARRFRDLLCVRFSFESHRIV